MVKAGLALILPSRVNYKDAYLYSSGVGVYYYRKNNDIIKIPGSGKGYDDLRVSLEKNQINDINSQLMVLPWIHGAKCEDYIDIVYKYSDEFEIYLNNLNKFFNNSQNPDKINEWFKELSYSIRKLDVIFKNKKKELYAKGFDVAIGIICTIEVLLLPQELAALKPGLAALSSTKTAYDGTRWLYDFHNAKNILSSENN